MFHCFRHEDRSEERHSDKAMRVRKKRPRPSGYEAEGFLCGPGDRPSRKKPSAKDAAEEWERMQNEIAAAKPRALTTKAQAGQEAAVAAARPS